MLFRSLKQQGKTQADLRQSLQACSTRMPAILEVLEREYELGGLPKLAHRLCEIEESWTQNKTSNSSVISNNDPFGQLDLLLEELREDSDN